MLGRVSRYRSLALLALAGASTVFTGCAVETQGGLVLFGDWAIGITRSADRCRTCKGHRFRHCHCGGCQNGCGQQQEETNDNMPADGQQQAEPEEVPARPAGRSNPPQAVHNRFHPVPTRPVFGNPTPPAPQQTIEALPHEYGSTPRLRSVPRPQLDPDEIKEGKQKAKEGERKEDEWIPWRTFP